MNADKFEQYWELEEDFIVVLKNCFDTSSQAIEKKGMQDKIFKYIGL